MADPLPDFDDPAPAILTHSTSGHDGPGWYYWSEEYPDEGSCGAFETREEAIAHLTGADMYVAEERETHPADPEEKR